MELHTGQVPEGGVVSEEPFRIYTGLLGQIGDIIMFTPTVRRIKELFPRSRITWAVSARYREAGGLVAGLPYVDRLFVTKLYCEKLSGAAYEPWQLGWPVELRGEDEIEEQRRHDIVFETRLLHRRTPWWEYGHLIEAYAYDAGVPGPVSLQTEIRIPAGTAVRPEAAGKIVFHNDPFLSDRKAWPWERAAEFIRRVGAGRVVLLGRPGPPFPGVLDLRGLTTLAEAAAIIDVAECYVGVDSGLLWIAGSLQAPSVGLFGTGVMPAYARIYPFNRNAVYVQAEGPLAAISAEMVVETMEQVMARAAAPAAANGVIQGGICDSPAREGRRC